MITRRQFLKATAATAAVASVGGFLRPRRAFAFNQSPLGIKKFVTPLNGLGPTGIPVLTPNTTKYPGTDYYEIVARQFSQTIYDDGTLKIAPKFWGYADKATLNSRYLGGVIVAQRGRPVKIKALNSLPASHILPIDPTAIDPPMAAEVGGRVDRIAIHLHGGLVKWTDDGGPFAWFSNPKNGGFVHGSSFLNGADATGAAIYDYPNNQSARLVWYHDHAYGLTRLNAYAGLASAYLITDQAEAQLISSGVLPNPLGGLYTYGVPLILQDKAFWNPGSDPSYIDAVTNANKGDIWYPHIYEGPGTSQPLPTNVIPPLCDGTGRWDWGTLTTTPPQNPPPVSLVAEAFFDTILVNGAPYPTLTLPPGRFRFRILNGSNARFYNLQMYVKDNSGDGITVAQNGELDNNGNPLMIPTNPAGPAFIQVGNEGGFLPAPVVFNTGGTTNVNSNLPMGYDPFTGNANRYNLLLAPAERADIIVDFRGYENQTIVLYTDAPAPFPGGDIRNDYYAGDTDLTCIGGAPATVAGSGKGPDTRTMMEFVISGTATTDMSFADTITALNTALPIAFNSTQPPALSASGLQAKVKTLNEDFDSFGRLRQRLGTAAITGTDPGTGLPLFGTDLLSSPTEVANRREVQVWQVFNTTGDTHPMHFHLVNVQILSRQQFNENLDGTFALVPGTAVGPDPNELGWKETVRMNPGEVTTVIMKFDLPGGGIGKISPRLLSSYNIKGAEYVWHCHILEHEEHDMMHALVVT